jgi:hypothetical protein
MRTLADPYNELFEILGSTINFVVMFVDEDIIVDIGGNVNACHNHVGCYIAYYNHEVPAGTHVPDPLPDSCYNCDADNITQLYYEDLDYDDNTISNVVDIIGFQNQCLYTSGVQNGLEGFPSIEECEDFQGFLLGILANCITYSDYCRGSNDGTTSCCPDCLDENFNAECPQNQENYTTTTTTPTTTTPTTTTPTTTTPTTTTPTTTTPTTTTPTTTTPTTTTPTTTTPAPFEYPEIYIDSTTTLVGTERQYIPYPYLLTDENLITLLTNSYYDQTGAQRAFTEGDQINIEWTTAEGPVTNRYDFSDIEQWGAPAGAGWYESANDIGLETVKDEVTWGHVTSLKLLPGMVLIIKWCKTAEIFGGCTYEDGGILQWTV